MIDWFNLLANSLWIFALSLAISTLSFARWEARDRDESLRSIMSQTKWQSPLNLAGVLFCGGLATTTDVIWERAAWGVLAILFIIQMIIVKCKVFSNNSNL